MPLHRPGDRELLNRLGSGADKAEILMAGKRGLAKLAIPALYAFLTMGANHPHGSPANFKYRQK
jgi:hypothetical protein